MADIRDWSTTASSNTDLFPEGMAPSAVNDSARTVQADIARLIIDDGGTLTTGGSGGAYTLSLSTQPASLTDGLAFSFTANHSNTTFATLTVTGASAFAAKRIRKFISTGEVDVGPGDIIAGGHYCVQYDSAANGGAGAFILLNPAVPGTWRLIEDWTASAGATVKDFAIPATVSRIRIAGQIYLSGAAGSLSISLRTSQDNGSTYPSTGTDYTSGTDGAGGTNGSQIPLIAAADNSVSNIPVLFSAYMMPGDAVRQPTLVSSCGVYNTLLAVRSIWGTRRAAGRATHIRIFSSITSGISAGSRIIVEGA